MLKCREINGNYNCHKFFTLSTVVRLLNNFNSPVVNLCDEGIRAKWWWRRMRKWIIRGRKFRHEVDTSACSLSFCSFVYSSFFSLSLSFQCIQMSFRWELDKLRSSGWKKLRGLKMNAQWWGIKSNL